jgi:hypothetical protein
MDYTIDEQKQRRSQPALADELATAAGSGVSEGATCNSLLESVDPTPTP